MKRVNKGFTLVELLAVIVILAIIMLIAIPAVLNTLSVAKRKSFIEYVDKIFITTQKQVLEEETMGNPVVGCKTFYIKKDLGLTSTGNYDGYVLVKNDGFNDIAYYITLHDDEFKIESYLYDGSLDTENLEYYNSEEEVDNMLACASAGCPSCSMDGDVSATEVCSSITQVNDSTPGSFAGSGTQNDPYKLESIEDLVVLSKGTNDGLLEKNKYYKLMVDLSFACDKSYVDPSGTSFGDINGDGTTSSIKEELTTSLGWVPIGSKDHPFSSTIMGNNKKIYGLYINSGDKYKSVAFIGYAIADDNNEFINDISFLDANVNASGDHTGIVFGYGNFSAKNGIVKNIKTSGNLVCHLGNCSSIAPLLDNKNRVEESSGSYTIVNTYYGETTYSNLINKANIIDNSDGSTYPRGILGGVIGYLNSSKINNIYNYGNITCVTQCGGAIGSVYNTEGTNIYNFGKIVGTSESSYLGGVIADLADNNDKNLILSNVYNYGDIISKFSTTGGCFGNIYRSKAYNAYNYGNINFTGERVQLGGVVGHINGASELHNAGNFGVVRTSGEFTLGGVIGLNEGISSNIFNYGKIIRDSKTQSRYIYAGGLVGEGSCYNCYSIADIDNLNGPIDSDGDRIGLAIGQGYQNKDTYNIYSVGTITNKINKNNWYHYYGGSFGNFMAFREKRKENYYSKVKLIGFPNVGVFAGYQDFYDSNGEKVGSNNIYIDMYTDATEVRDNYPAVPVGYYNNYYANLNNSPHKESFNIAQEYDFSQVNGLWFRDTLKLGDNWQYSNGYYPKLYKVLPNGSVSSELVEGQKDIPIK